MLDTVIVGGGIIGTSIAFALQREGREVAIVEPDELGTGAAAGSAGYISVGEIFPLASPEVVWNTPRLLFDPLGPLAIDPKYFLKLIPWGLRFLSAARNSHRERAVDALASLNRDAAGYLKRFADDAGIGDLLALDGGLLVCRDTSSLRHLESTVPVLQSYGIRVEVLNNAQLLDLEPALNAKMAGALFFADSARCADPRAFGVRLGQRVLAAGGTQVYAKANAIRPLESGTWEVVAENNTLVAQRVIVAAGVWSGELLRPLGYRVPIETERGYHLMLPEPHVALRRPMVFEEAHFCATPMNGGLRLAGTVEFAGTQAPMNPRRSDILFDLASQYIEGLHRGKPTRWMGFRPSLPDSLPAIGAASRHSNLFYCFGHQHLGLTQAAISARCITDIIANRRPPIEITPFDLRRFSRN